jgi:hypothetical protein
MPKVESLYTPVGTIKFPKTVIDEKELNFLTVPDDFPEDGVGQWKFQLVLDPKDPKVQELLAELDAQHKVIKGANFTPYKADKARKDPDDRDCKEYVDTGLVAINFTSGFPIKFIDSIKNEVKGAKIGWDSRVKVKFSTKAVNNKGKVGLGRYARVIQIVDLHEPGLDTSGFDEIEGAYKNEAAAKTAGEGWSE